MRGVAVAPALSSTFYAPRLQFWAVQGIENKRTFELSEEELTSIRDEVEKYSIEGDLRRFNALNIKRLKDIQCYRGRRHIAVRSCLALRGALAASLCLVAWYSVILPALLFVSI